jgi:hypothetical protein
MPVLENEVITEANACIEPDFSLIERPLRVLDQRERRIRRQAVPMYKIQWSHNTEEEATWETEDYLNTKYLRPLRVSGLPHCIVLKSNLRTRFRLRKGGRL